MHSDPVVLLISGQTLHLDSVRRGVAGSGCKCDVRRADDLPTAMARVAGGGVVLIVLDVSGWRGDQGKVDSMLKLPVLSPGLPFAIWSDSTDPQLFSIASRAGAAGFATGEDSAGEFTSILSKVIARGDPVATAAFMRPPPPATIIAVMGVKGGVGATTVAVNVAAALAVDARVILAEIRPSFGDLYSYFHPGRMVRGFSSGKAGNVAASIRSMLWPAPAAGGLRVLFGPQNSEDCGEIDATLAENWLQALAIEADFVVVDLQYSFSLANRRILGASNRLALVMEPAPACLRLTSLTLEAIRTWDSAPSMVGAVVVRRTAHGPPLSLTEIELELGVPILTIVPPADALCLEAARTHVPFIQGAPDSLITDSFVALARGFSQATA